MNVKIAYEYDLHDIINYTATIPVYHPFESEVVSHGRTIPESLRNLAEAIEVAEWESE